MPLPRILCGVVVSAGKMQRAVKVRTAKQIYNSFLKKACSPSQSNIFPNSHLLQQFLTYQNHLVSDPTSSLRTGDVVKIVHERRVSRHIKHTVLEIVAPWGPGIDERPPILSVEERERLRREKKEAKTARKRDKGRIAEAEVMEGTRVAS
ncbi:hypothetical protein MMC21_001925 [Puttea exsequens]|nr:hypothetical protein [Puttea exsequens]